MKPKVSLKKMIREMDSQEIEDFIIFTWKYKYNKDTLKFLSECENIILTCNACYNQLTGNNLIDRLSSELHNTI